MREKPRDPERLQHILESLSNIEEFITNKSAEDFAQDKMCQFAVIKNLEIIGEAAYHLTKELREETNDRFEWRKIITFRHILVHDYYRIELSIVWKTIEEKLPDLKESLIQLLEELNSNS